MTQSFEDWFKNEMPNSHKKVGKETIETVIYSCAESAWSYKQAEIDDHIKRRMELSKDKQDLLKEINEYKEVAESMEDAYLREKAKVDELQKKIDDALKAMDGESVNSWGLWKEKADMYEQGASNAYEKSYWILKGTNNEQ